MNSYGLIFNEFRSEKLPLSHTLENIDQIFKKIRHVIKDDFEGYRLNFDNFKGENAIAFNQRIARFGYDWLPFTISNYRVFENDFPSDDIILKDNLIQDSELFSKKEAVEKIIEEINQQTVNYSRPFNYCRKIRRLKKDSNLD